MELLWALEEDSRRALRRSRLFRSRTDILETYDDQRLIHDFRFPRHVILDLIQKCQSLGRKTLRNHALPVHIQVLAALRFYSRGTFQDDNKDIIGLSQPSVSRIVKDVSDILCRSAKEYIKFPCGDELMKVKQQIFEMNGLPNCIGVIDGTHIFINTPPGPEEPLYVCRKGGHSINVQIICNPDYTISDIVVKWPGSTHDSFIWSTCSRRATFLANPPNGWLMADSGYPTEPWILAPYDGTPTQSHVKFNSALSKTRSVVERVIGLWKGVFRRIHPTGGILMYKPKKCVKIILATAVLHNIRRKLNLDEDNNLELPPPLLEDADLIDSSRVSTANEITARGEATRDQIRSNFFNH